MSSYNSLKIEKNKNKKPRIAIESSIPSKQANEFVTFRNIQLFVHMFTSIELHECFNNDSC